MHPVAAPAGRFDDGETAIAATIAATKRRAYRVYLVVVAVGAGTLWFFLNAFGSETARAGAAVVVPVVVAFALSALVVLERYPKALRGVEIAQYVACVVIFLAQLGVTLAIAPDDLARHQAVAAFSVWIPVTSIWAFVVFGSRGGLVGAYGFIVAAAATIATFSLSGAGVSDGGFAFLVQLGAASLVFVAGLYAFTYLLERQAAERTAAEVTARFALHDVVTGLHSRFAFGVRFEQALAMARRSDRSLALLFVDLDGFKRVNDELGHAAGDEALREIARRLSAAVGLADTVARFGGDEFVVLSVVDDAAEAAGLRERLERAVAAPMVLEGVERIVRCSVGSSVRSGAGLDGAALLEAADRAMYAVKRAKGRRVAPSAAVALVF